MKIVGTIQELLQGIEINSLNETTVETVKKIGLGTYAMADLNNTFVMGNGQKYQQNLNK